VTTNRLNRFIFIALASALAWPSLAIAQQPAPPMNNNIGNIYGNNGIITQGQIGNNTLNVGPQPRNIDSPQAAGLKNQILKELPKDKPITVMALMGDGEGIQFAQQIHAFMKANGFMMKEPNGISQGVFTGAVKGLQRNNEPDGSITFIVGSNLH
jgi:hypothetical protein